jgi:hypothetical protein
MRSSRSAAPEGKGSENPKKALVYSEGERKAVSGITFGGVAAGGADCAKEPAARPAIRTKTAIKRNA